MKKSNQNGFRIPALAILATLAFGSVSAQDAATETKQMRVKIISTVDGKTTITDTTLAVSDNTNDIRRVLGEKHPFFYKDLPAMPVCRKAEAVRIEKDGAQIRKNMEERIWVRDTAMRHVRFSGPITIGEPEEIEKLMKTREVEIIRSPSVIKLRKDADGKASEIKLNGSPMEIEKLMEIKGLEPCATFVKSVNPGDLHRFTIISRDSLHNLDNIEVRSYRSAEEGDSRVIVLMSVEKPEGKELEELQEKNENIPLPKREMEVENLNLYPNPTNGRFTLNFDVENKGNTSIKVYDVNGREVYNEQVKALKGTYNKEIDLTGNPQGTYFVQVTQGKRGFTRKVVLQ